MSRNNSGLFALLRLTELEDRHTPASTTTAASLYALGVPTGQTGNVVVYNASGTMAYQITNPYGSNFTGGVRVALADVNGDGVPDLITAPGPGTAPLVNVYSGVTQQLIDSFDAYASTFMGGVNIAAGNLTGDGMADIVTGADVGGGPRVRVFEGSSVATGSSTPTTLDDFLGIDDPDFRGGVRIALGDINGDGVPDLVVAAGNGGGPRIAIYDGASLGKGEQVKLVNDFYAFDPSLRNGAYVAVGDINGDGYGDLIFGAGPGGGPRVLALDGKELLAGQTDVLANFFAGSQNDRAGVAVGTIVESDGSTDLVATDLATNATGIYNAAGTEVQVLVAGTGTGSSLPGLPGWASGPIAVTQSTATAVEGTYTGSGAGTLYTLAAGSVMPTSASSSATISLQITSATLNPAPRFAASSTTSYGLALTGTITITIEGQAAITLPVTGQFRLTSSTTVAGNLDLVSNQGGSGTAASPYEGVLIGASLSGTTLSLNQLSVFTYVRATGGMLFRSPTSRGGTVIELISSSDSTATSTGSPSEGGTAA